MRQFWSFVACLGWSCSVNAVLDGRVTPIYLENRYTFTNFEWARGNVYFKDGFDLPFGGTVILDINQEVGSTVRMMNGTLRLDGNLALSLDASLTGSGFIDARNKVISFKNNWDVQANERFIILSTVTFVGVGSNGLNLGSTGSTGGISVKNGVSEIRFIRFNFTTSYLYNFTTALNAPNVLRFQDCNFLLLANLTLNSNLIVFKGDITLLKSNRTFETINTLQVGFATTVHVQSQVTLKVSSIQASEESAQIILDNARLSYTPTGTYSLLFQRSYTGGPHQGTLVIRGRSEILTPSGVELFLSKNSTVDFDSGSVLQINGGTKFTIG